MKKLIYLVLSIFILNACTFKISERQAFWPVKVGEQKDYPPFTEVNIPFNDTLSINSVHYDNLESEKVILFFHGNSTNLWNKLKRINHADKAKIDFFMIDYAGFGKNKGTPSFENLYQYAEKSYEFVLTKYKKENIILMGTSIGSLPAAKMAAEGKGSRLILESMITSLEDLEDWVYGQSILLRLFINFEIDPKIKFDQYKVMKNVECPVLFIHPEEDQLSPIENVEEVYKITKSKLKYFYPVKDATHNKPFKHLDEYVEQLRNFIY
jgi:pimeloyl-ACP methyl ester carboxylesterase